MEETKMIVEFNNTSIECEGEEFQMIKELAEYYIDIPPTQKNNNNREEQKLKIKFGVEEIDGLKCIPYILIESYLHYQTKVRLYRVFFEVRSRHLECDEETGCVHSYYLEKIMNEQETFNYIDFMKTFIISKYLLSNLKYCYSENDLNLSPQNKTDLIVRIFENPNVKMRIDKCCVCHIETYNKTKCNHTLCFKCWEQINRDEEGDIPCPICRKDIKFID
jgi:hypothetical protein